MNELLKYFIPTTPFIAFLIFLFMNPEKADKWQALIWKWLSGINKFSKHLFKGAHKRYVKHDLQGRINEFTKKVAYAAPFLQNSRVRIELVGGEVNRQSSLREDQVVLRLRRDDPDESNFVHGAYLAVSGGLLNKVKRHISPSQREAVDLYVTTKLLEREKQSVVGFWVDNYLHPRTNGGNAKIGDLLERFATIDGAGLFYAVFLEELDMLGHKVFTRRRSDAVITEVRSLIEFLEGIATRKIGEERELNFAGDLVRCAIGIVGKPSKLAVEGKEVYIRFIRSVLIPRKIETLYLVGRWENREVLDDVCDGVADCYEKIRTRHHTVLVTYEYGQVELEQYMVVLRRKGISVIRPSAA